MTEWYEDAIGTTVEHANMPGPVFHLEPVGQLANQMIEYMVALKFADMVRDCRISNITIPAWGISHPPIKSPGPVATERREQRINLPAFADLVWSEQIGRVEWCGYGQRMENFLPPSRYQSVFVSPFSMPMGYGPDYLVCPVRAADILDGPAPDYALTPVEFYLDIVKQTGLTPVFIGQTHPNRYMDRISAAFPNAIFREPQDNVLVDFETIRQSKNLVIGVSTYSWLAAWLSQADNIYLTVSGLYNPMQKTDVDLLPFGDPRYKFFLFPINYGVPLSRHADVHRRIAPYWRQMPHEALRQQFDAAPRFARDLKQTLSLFDPEVLPRNERGRSGRRPAHGARICAGPLYSSRLCRAPLALPARSRMVRRSVSSRRLRGRTGRLRRVRSSLHGDRQGARLSAISAGD